MDRFESIEHINELDIAVIGMSGRFPGAKNIEEFWQNLRNGMESISFFSDQDIESSGIDPAMLVHPSYVKAASVLDDVELFDASFFGYSPREAEMIDPQSRIFMECAWEALESAGYDPKTYEGSIGVYASQFMSTYLLKNVYSGFDFRKFTLSAGFLQTMIANERDFLPTRVSYKLNLRGPSINIQTACSSSLVAIHLARQSLLIGECDIALAGGVSIYLPQKEGYLYEEGMIFSPDGHCRAFDAKAKGTIFGNGVGIVVLKPLTNAIADGDWIHAVIKGSAINNDGSSKVGYTAPSAKGQADVITEALANAGVEAETISYIETHGTGTTLGDPIEIAALTQTFRASTQKKGFCAIGSVKTNIGHLGHAAGITGLIKVVQSLKHKLLPPSLHFDEPNPKIDFANSPFYVNATLGEWKAGRTPRRAGVSSFGIGGTNAHVVLEEAPIVEPSGESRPKQLLVLSAKTSSALETATANLVEYLKQHPDVNLADVAYTYQVGRRAFSHRRILVCHDLDDAVSALETLEPKRVLTSFQKPRERTVVFMFSGQGAQYVNMARELYQVEPVFREQVDLCLDLLKPHLELDLRQVLYPTNENQLQAATQQLEQTAITQPALFVIEYALAKLWMEWGVSPSAMIGHSIGEYVAACLAGVFALEDALALVAARGRLMQKLPTGSMLAVPLPEQEVQPLLGKQLSLAAINGPSLCVVSGSTDAVEQLEGKLSQQGVECRRLHTSHAFHSEMMVPILGEFTEKVKKVKLQPPQIPYVANVTGTWITAAEATAPSYWARHLRQTVLFDAGLHELLKEPERVLLEVGPGRTLSTLARRHPDKSTEIVVLSSIRHPHDQLSDEAFLLNALGQLWLAGIQVDWSGFYAHEQRHRIPLPTYPFERQQYWVEPQKPLQDSVSRNLKAVATENITLNIEADHGLIIAQQPAEVLATVNGHRSEKQSLQSVRGISNQKSLDCSPWKRNLQNAYVAPRNELEQSLVDIWQDLLGIGQVGIDDNFFELGGESIMALQLIQNLHKTLQVELSQNTLLEAPTPAALAELIAQASATFERSVGQPGQALPSPLVAIRSDGSKRPFFCIHPIGGNVLSYANVARHLDSDQPFYGLQARGLDGKQNPLTQIEDMAVDYIQALRGVQPQGPYLLGGWSFGGVVAFEMAQQLQHQGHKVALLALIDSAALLQGSSVAELDDAALLAWFATDLGISSGKDGAGLVNALRRLEPDAQLPYILELAKRVNVLPATFELDQIQPRFKVFNTNFRAIYSYVPQVYSNQITLFRSSEWFTFFQSHELFSGIFEAPREPALGWDELSLEPVEVHTIPGNHYTILAEPQVQVLGQWLRRCLDKAPVG